MQIKQKVHLCVKSCSAICNAQSTDNEIEGTRSSPASLYLKFPVAPEGSIIEKLMEAV